MLRFLKFLRLFFVAVFIAVLCVPAAADSPEKILLELKRSRAEMKAVFTSPLCAQLKKNVSEKTVKRMKNPILKDIAERMLDKTYKPKVRRHRFRPYYPVSKLSKELKTNFYSQFENPTGVYFKEGEIAVVFVGKIPKGEEVALKIQCWDQDERYGKGDRYPLHSGANVFEVKHNGLAYFDYYTENLDAAPIAVNIATGTPNGVFYEASSTNEDWEEMLDNIEGDCFDIVGKYVQLVFCAETMKKTCPEDGLALIRNYDEIIRLQQNEIMGLEQFGRRKPNHMHGRTMWKGFMHADGFGAAFNDNTMNQVGNPESALKNSWAISHEFGHVNQTRPNLMWVCTTEVTNNIYSCWANYKLSPENLRLETENCADRMGGIIGGRFNSYLNSALVYKENWLCQYGPDKRKDYEDGGDHFVKVAPLWQLQLYMNVAGRGPADFYPQMFEIARKAEIPKTEDGKNDNGALQLEFMKNACKVSKQNLMPFFEAIGMLKPIDREMDDYVRGQLTITEEDCKKLKKFGEKFPPAASPVIYYICANNIEAFKQGLPVKGSRGRAVKVSDDGTTLTFPHSKWKNVVAYETYSGDELTQISMTGLGSKNNEFTVVRYPEGSTRVEAVGWDGTRTHAYGKKKAKKK